MQNLIAKTAGVVVAIALFVGVAVPAANALTSSELVELLISLGIISGENADAARTALGDNNTTTTSNTGVCSITRDLTIGATGADVVTLQDTLIANNFLVIPAGVSKGYFGTLTQSAVAQWQMSLGVTPAVGYFGNLTRGAIASSCTTTVVDNGGSDDSDSDDSDNGSSNSSTLGSGEASLESFELNDDEDEVAEGESEVVAVAEFDVEDGDVKIERLDLTFATNTNEENEPWDAFEEIALWVNGDRMVSEDVSDEDDWIDEDGPYVFRFSGLDYVVMDGDTAEISIQITAADSVDGADDTGAEWTIYINGNGTSDGGIRVIDGEGIYQYIGDIDEEVTFDIVAEGEGDDLEVKTSNDEIDENTIILDDDDDTDAPIFAFVLSADDSDNDIEIDEIKIDVEISSTTGSIEDLVNDFWIEIDGEKIDAENYNDDISTTTLTFDVDGDVTIDAEDEVEVVLYVDFKEMESDSDYQGVTIVASLDGEDVEAEGRDEIKTSDVDGSAEGEEQTLRSQGIDVELVDSSVNSTYNTDNTSESYGTYVLEIEVAAIGETLYIPTTAAFSETASTTLGASYIFENASGVAYTSGTTTESFVRKSGGTVQSNGNVRINDGSSAVFELTVTLDPAAQGQYRAQLISVGFDDNNVDTLADTTVSATPASDFETSPKLINN